jgi:hypothetical protein
MTKEQEPVIYDSEKNDKVTKFTMANSGDLHIEQFHPDRGMQEIILDRSETNRMVYDLIAMSKSTMITAVQKSDRPYNLPAKILVVESIGISVEVDIPDAKIDAFYEFIERLRNGIAKSQAVLTDSRSLLLMLQLTGERHVFIPLKNRGKEEDLFDMRKYTYLHKNTQRTPWDKSKVLEENGMVIISDNWLSVAGLQSLEKFALSIRELLGDVK